MRLPVSLQSMQARHASSRKRQRDDDDDNERGALAGRVVLITGAGGGIGRATALECARRGARVVAADLVAATAAATASEIDSLGGAGPCLAIPESVDVADEASVAAMIDTAVGRFGRLDMALNAAGIEGERAPLHESSVENYDRVLSVNLRGVYLCMRAEIAQMLKQQAPAVSSSTPAKPSPPNPSTPIDDLNYSIVNVSSSAGLAGMPEFACYSASKHAINGLTRSAAREYAARGIRVNALCPSTTDTPMVARFTDQWPEWQAKQNASFPVGRIGTAEEVARTAAFLFSAECPMMTGHCLTIDGALSA